jgi:anionic cell wall polymer biosynthesis LytR-Cps2A-Psr (LCP) family protein
MANAGTYHFRGHSAVIYMRIRKAGGGGDFMRTQRVRNVLSTLADNCREISYEDARALVDVILDQSTLTNMSLNDMIEAMDQAYQLRGCTMEELRIPITGAAHSIYYGGSVQEIDWPACRAAFADYMQNSYLVLDDSGEEDDFIFD